MGLGMENWILKNDGNFLIMNDLIKNNYKRMDNLIKGRNSIKLVKF